MSVEELEELLLKVKTVLAERRKGTKEFSFEFCATNDPKKGIPFVARLYWADGKVQREFFDLDRQYGKKEVTISGKYTAKAGDIIEKRTGGSWKNDYRNWYLIGDTGEEIYVADISNSAAKTRVTRYLKGEISAEELIQLT